MLQRGGLDAVHHSHRFLDVLQDDSSLVLIRFEVQGLHYVVAELVCQKVVKVHFSRRVDVLYHKLVLLVNSGV